MSSAQLVEPDLASSKRIEGLYDRAHLWNVIVWDDPVTTFEQVIGAWKGSRGDATQR